MFNTPTTPSTQFTGGNHPLNMPTTATISDYTQSAYYSTVFYSNRYSREDAFEQLLWEQAEMRRWTKALWSKLQKPLRLLCSTERKPQTHPPAVLLVRSRGQAPRKAA